MSEKPQSEERLSEKEPLEKLKQVVYTVSAFLVLALIVAVPTALDVLDLPWATSIAVFLLVLALFMLNLRSDLAVKIFKRLRLHLLIPALDKVIAHYEDLERCRAMVKGMEHTLDFYNLWPLVKVDECGANKQNGLDVREPTFRDRMAKRLSNLRAHLKRGKRDTQKPIFRDRVAKQLLTVGEEKRIERCAQKVAECLDLNTDDERIRSVRESAEKLLESTETPIAERERALRALEIRLWSYLLELLYREYHRLPRADLWKCEKDHLISGLAAILHKSEQLLPDKKEGVPYEKTELEDFLGELSEFTLDLVKAGVLVDQMRRQENRIVVENMEQTLVFYDLHGLLKPDESKTPQDAGDRSAMKPDESDTQDADDRSVLSPTFHDKLIDALLIADTERERIERCARKVAEELISKTEDERIERVRESAVEVAEEAAGPKASERHVWSYLLELLYRGRFHKSSTTVLWKREKELLIPGLAVILYESGQLPSTEGDDLPYQVRHVERVLRELPDFSFEGFINNLTAYQTQRRENHAVIIMMIPTLVYYDLCKFLDDKDRTEDEEGRCTLSQTFRVKLTDDLPKADTEEERIRNCAAKIVERLRGFDPPISTDLLVLLHQARYGLSKEVQKLWDREKEHLIPGLAAVLLGSVWQPRDDGGFPCQAEDLARLLNKLENFTLTQVRAELDTLDAIWRRAIRYHKFLKENGVAGWKPQVAEMLTHIEGLKALPTDDRTLDRLSEATPDVLIWVGEAVIRAAFPDHRLAATLPLLYQAEEEVIRRAFPSPELASNSPLLDQLGAAAIRRAFDGLELTLTSPILDQEEEAAVRKAFPNFDSIPNLQILCQVGAGAVRKAFPDRDLAPDSPILDQVEADAMRAAFPDLESLATLPILEQAEKEAVRLAFPDLDSISSLPVFVQVGTDAIRNAFPNLESLSTSSILSQLGMDAIREALPDIESLATLPTLGQVEVYASRRAFPDLETISSTPILDQAGADAVREALPSLLASLPYSLCLVSLIVFLTKDPSLDSQELRKTICHKAVQKDKAVRVVFSYLEFSRDLRIEGQRGVEDDVRIGYLIENWAWRVKKKKSDLDLGFEEERDTVRNALWNNDWPDLPSLIERTFDNVHEKNKQLVGQVENLVGQRESIREALKEVFRRLTIQTVERYLETRKHIAYLLTFRVQRGTVAKLLEFFVAPKKQKKLAEIGVALEVDGQPKYNFRQYTDSARIGVVPEGWTLERFYNAFQADFDTVIRHRHKLLPDFDWAKHELEDIEVIVHRFGFSGRNYYGFVSEDLTRPRAMQEIRGLFSDHLSPAEQVTLIAYEGKEDIVNAIKDGPITILIGDKVKLRKGEREALEQGERRLKDRVVAKLKCSTIQELAQVVHQDANKRRQAKMRLAVLLKQTIPEFKGRPARCKKIADIYIETLAIVAVIGTDGAGGN